MQGTTEEVRLHVLSNVGLLPAAWRRQLKAPARFRQFCDKATWRVRSSYPKSSFSARR